MPDWLLKVQRIRQTSQDDASMLFSALWSFKAEHAVGSVDRDSTSRSTGLCTSRVSVYWIDRATSRACLAWFLHSRSENRQAYSEGFSLITVQIAGSVSYF